MKKAWGGLAVAWGLSALAAVGCSSSAEADSDAAANDASDADGSNADSASGGSSGHPPGLGSCTVFPADNAWNLDVSALPLHERSDAYIDSIGRDDNVHPDFGTVWEGAAIGIPYVVVDASTPAIEIDYQAYGDESDPGPFPIPLDTPIEGAPDTTGDCHVIAVDGENCKLYELYRGKVVGDVWQADSGVVWDLNENDSHPPGCTSADAAGLPIFPGLVRYDEVVEQKEIRHAIRFTVSRSQAAYVAPATHFASNETDANLPPMGLRLRMKADFDCTKFSDEASVVCTALKRYGLIVADNGSDWYLSGAPDSRWDDDALGDLKTIPGDAFEVVDTGGALVTELPDCVIP